MKGLHHITIMCGDPTTNAEFYVNTLGIRLVKKTVNHDAPGVWHLFYGDKKGTPGSSITFFPEMTERGTEEGAGMVTELGLRAPETSLDYWKQRLDDKGIGFEEQEWHGKNTLSFRDPDGLALRIVPEESEEFAAWEDSRVTDEHQLQGMHHVEMSVADEERARRLLELMQLEEKEDNYYVAEDNSKVEVTEVETQGTPGRGSVHHIAFKVEDEEQEMWREKLRRNGINPSPLISRKYFTSFYFRTPFGVLFEFSNMQPGYTADEDVEELGQNFVLPENLEERRQEIMENLPEFDESSLP